MTSLPSISLKNDLWLNLESTKSVLSWYKIILERRKKIKDNKKLKESTKKKGNMFNMVANQDADYEAKEWKQIYFEFCEKNTDEDDDLYRDDTDDIFRFL